MKTVLLSLGFLLLNISLSPAQTKKIALHSHSGVNSNFTIYVPDEFGLGPIDYNYRPSIDKKKCLPKVKPIQPGEIQLKDSMDSIQYCRPLPPTDKVKPTPKFEPNSKNKKAKQTAKKEIQKASKKVMPQAIKQQNNVSSTQLAAFSAPQSSEPILILLLSISALLFFFFPNQNP